MESRQISRRFVITALGSGIALAPVMARAAVSKVSGEPASGESGREAIALEASLITPLTVGSKVAGCTLVKIGALAQGAIGLVLTDRSGQQFGVEICARDEGSPRSPAETAKFQLYVVNEGDGSLPTVEEHGIAAMTIASVIRKNEAAVETSSFLTLEERLARHGSEITRPD